MKYRVDLIIDVPDDYDEGCVEQFIEDAVMYLAQDQSEDVDIKEFIDISEVE